MPLCGRKLKRIAFKNNVNNNVNNNILEPKKCRFVTLILIPIQIKKYHD